MKKRIIISLLSVAVILLMSVSVPATSYGDSATVYVSLTDDGEFVTANDGTVLAQVPITVDYFDLADYGLEKYYRYQDVDGQYVEGAEVLERPTLLHCFIRLLEKYYAGRKLTPEEIHSDIINVTGNPRSSYLNRFWGHDQNLVYQVNHDYQIMSGTTLATCDYILLEDEDEINIGMFTDWNFHKEGAFAYFTEPRRSAYIGEEILLDMRCRNTMAGLFGNPVPPEPMHNETIRISSDCGKTWNATNITTDMNGECRLSFERAGTYYISAGPSFNTYQFVAPPICIVNVTDSTEPDPADLLAAAKTQAKSDLVAYKETKDLSLYRDEQKRELVRAVEQGEAAIDAAQTADAVGQALSEAKAAIDAVKTDAQITEEEKRAANAAEEIAAQKEAQKARALTARIKAAKAAKPAVKVKALAKHKAKITWGKVRLSYIVDGKKYTGAVTGYKIYRATKKNGKYKLIKTIKKAGILKYTDKNLKKGKKYYYKVRTYTRIDGKTYLGKWSKVRKITPK